MKKALFIFLVCLVGCASNKMASSNAATPKVQVDPSEAIVKDVKWSYEVYKENEKVINCSQATVQGTLSMGPYFPQREMIPTLNKKIHCETLAPAYNHTTKLHDRQVECMSIDRFHKVLAKLTISCGETKRSDTQVLQAKLKAKGLKLRFFCYF
jgi:hypothetical protein